MGRAAPSSPDEDKHGASIDLAAPTIRDLQSQISVTRCRCGPPIPGPAGRDGRDGRDAVVVPTPTPTPPT
jgi:hypothetical protein